MGWFDEQIRQRKLSDQETFEESIFRMASVVLGKRGANDLEDDRIITKAAIDDILKYYHAKPVEIPASIRDADEALDYCLRPHGIMRRTCRACRMERCHARSRMCATCSRSGIGTA